MAPGLTRVSLLDKQIGLGLLGRLTSIGPRTVREKEIDHVVLEKWATWPGARGTACQKGEVGWVECDFEHMKPREIQKGLIIFWIQIQTKSNGSRTKTLNQLKIKRKRHENATSIHIKPKLI
jgi:hypothetical protein